MPFLRNYSIPGFTYTNAYHRILLIDDSTEYFGFITVTFEVFPSAAAAAKLPSVRTLLLDAEGNKQFNQDRTDYLWEDTPNPERTVGKPIGTIQVEIWNRRPNERIGVTDRLWVNNATLFNAILSKGTPVAAPGGTAQETRYNRKAQVYRWLLSLAQFSDATVPGNDDT